MAQELYEAKNVRMHKFTCSHQGVHQLTFFKVRQFHHFILNIFLCINVVKGQKKKCIYLVAE